MPPSQRRRSLDEISADYERAEITVLWSHEPGVGHTMLYGVVELCPVEQPSSKPIESREVDGVTFSMRRTPLDGNRSLYATRLLDQSVGTGIAFYRGVGGTRKLELPSGPADIESMHNLVEEPPHEAPLLVAERGKESYESVLPLRHTQHRVCSQLGQGASYMDAQGEKARIRLRDFSRETIGIDLDMYAEHLGAVHLCMSNPLLRAMRQSLSGDDRTLLIKMYERLGRVANGCRLRIAGRQLHSPGDDNYIAPSVTG